MYASVCDVGTQACMYICMYVGMYVRFDVGMYACSMYDHLYE